MILRADTAFRALGTTVRVLVSAPDAPLLADAARAEIERFERCCSRFLPGSELVALNADPRRTVPASPLLRAAVRAALWAAERSGGLVDPCLLDAVEAAGYRRSLAHGLPSGQPVQGTDMLASAPGRWRAIRVDDATGTITRPPGLRLDLGGSGKGFIADRVAAAFASARSWVVDAGGDVRLGGTHEVHVADPLGGEPLARWALRDTAVATSSITKRAWPGGHHLIDPATGKPARTRLLQVTALAPTTLEAETLAKAALLGGPSAARRVLAPRGGLIVHTDGAAEPIAAPGTGGQAPCPLNQFQPELVRGTEGLALRPRDVEVALRPLEMAVRPLEEAT